MRTEISWVAYKVPLLDEEGEPTWFEHPIRGREIDIAVIDLTDVFQMETYPINQVFEDPDIDLAVAQNVFVVGYPFGMEASNNRIGADGPILIVSVSEQPPSRAYYTERRVNPRHGCRNCPSLSRQYACESLRDGERWCPMFAKFILPAIAALTCQWSAQANTSTTGHAPYKGIDYQDPVIPCRTIANGSRECLIDNSSEALVMKSGVMVRSHWAICPWAGAEQYCDEIVKVSGFTPIVEFIQQDASTKMFYSCPDCRFLSKPMLGSDGFAHVLFVKKDGTSGVYRFAEDGGLQSSVTLSDSLSLKFQDQSNTHASVAALSEFGTKILIDAGNSVFVFDEAEGRARIRGYSADGNKIGEFISGFSVFISEPLALRRGGFAIVANEGQSSKLLLVNGVLNVKEHLMGTFTNAKVLEKSDRSLVFLGFNRGDSLGRGRSCRLKFLRSNGSPIFDSYRQNENGCEPNHFITPQYDGWDEHYPFLIFDIALAADDRLVYATDENGDHVGYLCSIGHYSDQNGYQREMASTKNHYRPDGCFVATSGLGFTRTARLTILSDGSAALSTDRVWHYPSLPKFPIAGPKNIQSGQQVGWADGLIQSFGSNIIVSAQGLAIFQP